MSENSLRLLNVYKIILPRKMGFQLWILLLAINKKAQVIFAHT